MGQMLRVHVVRFRETNTRLGSGYWGGGGGGE